MKEHDGEITVQARVAGDFPGSPAVLRYVSGLGDDRIQSSLSVKPKRRRFPDLADQLRSSSRSVSTSKPSGVTAMVCSHWAERRLSRVTTVQPSGLVRTAALP